jgi:hypothetical protein
MEKGSMIALLAVIVALASFMALCLAMPRHHRQFWHAAPGRRRQHVLRGGGIAGLLLSWWLSGLAWGWAIGPIAWFGVSTAASLAIVFLLPVMARE